MRCSPLLSKVRLLAVALACAVPAFAAEPVVTATHPQPPSALNALVLQAVAQMPEGGGYSVRNTAAKLASAIGIDAAKTSLAIRPQVAQPSFCSGATYLVFLSVVEEMQNRGELTLSSEALKALAVSGQPDGVGVWGRWNANGPGTAKLVSDLELGENFADIGQAQPGDFMKIWWTGEIGSHERGHSVVFLGVERDAGGEFVKFWSSNQGTGYGTKRIPRERVARVLFSRLSNLANLEKVKQLPFKDRYLADMLKRSSSESEMFSQCALASPAGSSLLQSKTARRL